MGDACVELAGETERDSDAGISRGNRDLIGALLSRRSVAPKRLKEPGPSEAEIRLMIEAAMAAPDHGNLRPWRAVLVPQSLRSQLADAFKAAKLEEHPSSTEEELDKAGKKAFNAPALLVILIEPVSGHAKVTVEEQFIGLGAALQNLLLAAHDLGYAAMITSGEKVRTRALQFCFAKTSGERVVGFISIGTPASGSLPRSRPDGSGRLSNWRGFAEV